MNNYFKNSQKILLKLNNYKNLNQTNIRYNVFFYNLYENMKKEMLKININEIEAEKISISVNNYFEDNQFTSEEIKKYIFENLKYCYKFQYENNTIIFFCKKNIRKIPKKIYDMFVIIKLLKILFKRNSEQKIIYFETDKKKKLPSKNKILGPNEVNSGLTYLDFHKNGDIILYRKEELLKVLIHELIHSNLIDKELIFSNKSKKINDIICSNYKILLNEGFTETFATIINIFYIHIKLNLDLKYLNIMFQNEINYSNYITNKIIKFYNIEKIDNIIKINNKCSEYFLQETNVISYYLFKNILLNNHLELGKILLNNNKNYQINNENAIIEIINLIESNIDKIKIYNFKDKNKSLKLCLYEI